MLATSLPLSRPQRSNGYSDCRTLSDTELMQMMTASPYQDELGCWVKMRAAVAGGTSSATRCSTPTSATLPSRNKLTKGAYGYVKGPATNPSVIGKAVDVFFLGNTDNISCRLTQLSYSRTSCRRGRSIALGWDGRPGPIYDTLSTSYHGDGREAAVGDSLWRSARAARCGGAVRSSWSPRLELRGRR